MHIVGQRGGVARATRLLLLAAIFLAVTHHVDHVLRVDHSGWPFRPDVTPFTLSLAAYPILFFALLGAERLLWLRWAFLVLGTAFTVYAHSRMESPQMQYAMWAYDRSLEPQLWNVRNLCGVESGGLGMAAVIVSMALNVVLVTSCIAMFSDGLKRRP